MNFVDRAIQRWRIAKVRPLVALGSRILDIGSADGALFRELGNAGEGSMGIDPTLGTTIQVGSVPLVAGTFPKDMPTAKPFDVITMLAVLEHFPASQYDELIDGCLRFLRPGGLLIITVPSPWTDHILTVLKFLKVIDGMSLEEHHGYRVEQTTVLFSSNAFRLLRWQRFQLGLNNLFVFERLSEVASR
jgi:2-polyprenyl-3-methyl-5-hydroxy-6-metoxy-1,4-benzoquinol methylase